MEKAELGETSTTDKGYERRLQQIVDAARIPETRKERLKGLKKEELLREIVDNVGKRGGAGQDLQKVVSVAMLSEGWDAKNVTHIMGLRAFTSQLLCEQVIGRGLRRVSYDQDENGLFLPEYVNVFGVPVRVSSPANASEILFGHGHVVERCRVSGLKMRLSHAAGPYGSAKIRSITLTRAQGASARTGFPDPVLSTVCP